MRQLIKLAAGASLAAWAALPAGSVASTVRPWTEIGDADRGESYAHRWCAACHKEDGKVASDGIPTFGMIADRARRDPAEMRAFLMRPHPPMPPLELNREQIADFVAFFHRYHAD